MSKLKFENNGKSKEYEVKIICNSAVYANGNKLTDYLSDLYYLVL